jgi:hypothetical protein
MPLLPLVLAAKSSGAGLLLSPRNLDRDLLSLGSLPPTIIGPQVAGRGYLAVRGRGGAVQVVS